MSKMIGANRFYKYWALVFILIIAIGFAPRYWIPLFKGELDFPKIVHWHAITSVVFIFFYLTQVILVSKRKIRIHQIFGYGSVILAIGVLISGVLVSLDLVERSIAASRAGAKPSLLINLLDMVLFGTIYSLGIINRKTADRHKRLITLSIIVLMNAGLFRIGRMIIGPGFAAILLAVVLLAVLFILYALLDRRRYGKIHPTIKKIGLIIIVINIIRIPIAITPFWVKITDWILSLV